jgi:hypothetical protein
LPKYAGILPEYFARITINRGFLPRENETNEKRTKMNDDVATAGDSAPNWHEQPQWYMTKDRRAITYGARTDVADVSGR